MKNFIITFLSFCFTIGGYSQCQIGIETSEANPHITSINDCGWQTDVTVGSGAYVNFQFSTYTHWQFRVSGGNTSRINETRVCDGTNNYAENYNWWSGTSTTNRLGTLRDNSSWIGGTTGSATLQYRLAPPTVSITNGAGPINTCNGSVDLNATYTYDGNNSVLWSRTAGSGSINSSSGLVSGIPVNSSGTFRARSQNGNCIADDVIIVYNRTPAITSVSSSGTSCSSRTITASGGAGGTIYYQGTTSNGTSTATASSSVSVTSSGTYYFRAYNATYGCWGAQGSVTVTIETEPTAPTTITGTTFICAGSSTTLTASGGSDGSGATWQWYTGSCGGTLVGGATTATTTVSPSTTTTYYARRVGNTSCTSTTACASVTVTVNGSATTPSGATLPAATATATCVVNDNNWHHFYDTNGDLLASINSNNQNLGSVTVTIEVGNEGPFGAGLAPGVCGYSGASGGEYALARNWDITVGTQPTSAVDVKFYYELTEVADLTTNIATLPANPANYIACWGNVASESDLMMTVSHTSGGTQLFTSLSPIAGPGTGIREIGFALSEFSSGKLHSNGGIHTSNPLPVELLSFEARPIDNEYIKLAWTTVTEINNEGFELLRSTDGQEFEKIAWIAGNGNTTEQQTYSFNDTKVATGTYYYKLKQIDFDGESEEFNVISATINNDFANAEMTVRPIPTSNTITVDVMSVSNTNTTISVFNYAGQRVLEINKKLAEGKNSLTLEEVSELSSGIYYVNLTVNDKVFTQKFVVSK